LKVDIYVLLSSLVFRDIQLLTALSSVIWQCFVWTCCPAFTAQWLFSHCGSLACMHSTDEVIVYGIGCSLPSCTCV